MVLYFSATGNTEYIAKEIAKQLDDECLNLLDRMKNNDNSELHS
ncbi:MAG: flavodoxin domain-containing protein, partial [Lachnospiraceae bacterium]|nr:flavodoxin domain-containing protein [Lachnospiraceae bacterium]